MTAPGVHPDSNVPYQTVARASAPCVKVHDLAMLEFAGPDRERARAFFTCFGLRCTDAADGSLWFSAEAGAPFAVISRSAAVVECPVPHLRHQRPGRP